MNYFDMILIGLVCIFALKGFFRGAINETINLVVIFLALFIAPIFATQTGNFLIKTFNFKISEDIVYFYGMGMLIVFMLIVGFMISIIAHIIMKTTGLKIVDRLVGIIIGGVKIILIISIFATLGYKIEITKQYLVQFSEKSTYFKQILSIGDKIIVKANIVKENIEKNKESIEKTSNELSTNFIKQTNLKEKVDYIRRDENIKELNTNFTNTLNQIENRIEDIKK